MFKPIVTFVAYTILKREIDPGHDRVTLRRCRPAQTVAPRIGLGQSSAKTSLLQLLKPRC